jgi:hypothetical protein
VSVEIKKNLRVDLTRIIVEPTRSTVQLAMQRADSTCVESTMVNENKHVDHNHTHTCQNHTLRVKITLVRAEITVVSVVVIFVRVKITLRVEITLCVYKSYYSVSLTHSKVSYSHASVKITLMSMEIILCV